MAEGQQGPIGAGGWSNHLFGCFNNFQICLTTFIVPFVTFGTTAEQVGECNCIVGAMAFFIPIYNCILWADIRGKIREMKGIPGTRTNDCLVIIFLPFCALNQEAQEMTQMAPQSQSMSRA